MTADKHDLKIDHIILENFKTYKGIVELKLSMDPIHTITAIQGIIGSGKTTILEAIYWCLYGKERLDARIYSGEGIVNGAMLNQLSIRESMNTSVTVSLYEQSKPRYKIKRTITLVKESESYESRFNPSVGGSLPDGIKHTEKIDYQELPRTSDDWFTSNVLSDANERIEELFPESLSSYFLFDGELLDKFFKVDGQNNVKKGIEQISGLPMLKNAKNHLDTTLKEIRKSIKNVDTVSLEEQIANHEITIGKSDEKIKDMDGKILNKKQEIEKIETYLRNNSLEMIQKNQYRRDELNKDIRHIKGQRGDNNQQITNWILRANVLVRLRESIQQSLSLCDEWESKGIIPIAVSSDTLHNMLEADVPTCICGTYLDEGSDARKRIQKHLDSIVAESPLTQKISSDGRRIWNNLIEEINKLKTDMDKHRSKRNELLTQLNNKENEIRKLDKELQGMDQARIRKESLRRENLHSEIDQLNRDNAIEKNKNEMATRSKIPLEEKLDKIIRKNKTYDSQTYMMDLAKKINFLFGQCEDELIEEMRSIVVKKTTEYFKKLVSRKDDFSEIEIKPNYQTAVYGPDNKSKSLSAGQACCLALSYIAAIREIAEKEYFMVIDSPLLKISQEERMDIAKNLPKFVPRTQITLLVQDQEYLSTIDGGPSVRDVLFGNKNLGYEYELLSRQEETDTTSSTHIKQKEVNYG